MLFVKIENDVVTQVWDTLPPADEKGWFPAVEVNQPVHGRQGKHGHSFDITKNPVEIVYDLFDISVDERRANMIQNAEWTVDVVKNSPVVNPGPEDIAAAEAKRDALIERLTAAQDHNTLDQIQFDM